MKWIPTLKSAALAAVTAGLVQGQATAQTFSPNAAFKKPLVSGASVSADWNTLSPGKTLALRYTDPKSIKTIAFGGRPGREVIKDIRREVVQDRSIILAVDFLFWDSTLSETGPSVKALDQLVGYAEERELPLVLGEIPELLPGRQGQRMALNEAIKTRCSRYKLCFLMPFDTLHRQILSEGFLEIKGKKYTIRELVPDGLHLSSPATEYLADLMLAVLHRREVQRKGRIDFS